MTDDAGIFPDYTDSGLSGKDVLFAGLSDLHFFVEDEDQESLYEVLIQRVFPRMSSFKIFPLGGKRNVIAHASAGHPVMAGEKRIYLLDKDFDDLLGRIVVRRDVVYYDEYCIENCLIDKKSINRFAVDEDPKGRNVEQRVRFDAVMKDWLPSLDRLHRAFFLVQKHELGIRNCDSPPDIYVSPSRPLIFDDAAIERYVASVADALVRAGIINDPSEYDELARRAFGSARKSLKNVSGKFLLKTLIRHLRYENVCGNVRIESVTIRLARYSDFKRMGAWRNRVNSAINDN